MTTQRNIKYQTLNDTDTQIAKDIIAQCDYGVLSTADNAGFPYGVPLHHVLTGNSIYFHFLSTEREIANIIQNDKVSMTFVSDYAINENTFTTYYESTIIEGIAQPITDRNEKRHALRLLCQRFAPNCIKEAEQMPFAQLLQIGIIRIDISHINLKIHKHQ